MTYVVKEAFLSVKESVNAFGHGVKLTGEFTDFIVFVPDFVGNANVKDTLRSLLHGHCSFLIGRVDVHATLPATNTEIKAAIRVQPHQGIFHMMSRMGLGGMSVRTAKKR